MRRIVPVGAFVLLAALGAWQLPSLGPDYLSRIVILIALYGILVASLGLGSGFTGVFSLGHVGFVGAGAYVAAILSLPVAEKASLLPNLPGWLAWFDVPFLPATLAAGIFASALAVLVGLPLMRLSGHFVSVATMGFLIIVNNVLINADDYTRGARTFSGIPLDTTLPWALGWLAVTLLVIGLLVFSPVGVRMKAVRDDPIAARALGIDVLRVRLVAFAVGAFFAGVGGSLYGHYLGSLAPNTFYFPLTISLVAMLVVGGMGSLTGALVGTVFVVVLSELLRALERGFTLGPFVVPALFGASQIGLGMLFILVMIFRPAGIMGQQEFRPFRIRPSALTAAKTRTGALHGPS